MSGSVGVLSLELLEESCELANYNWQRAGSELGAPGRL